MNRSYRNKLVPIPILLIEDEVDFSAPLKGQLGLILTQIGHPIVTIASDLNEADHQIRGKPFSAIQVDIRIPKNPGGIVEGSATGLLSAELASKLLPMSLNVLWSNFAHVHPAAARHSGQYDCPYWSKGVAAEDIKPELPHYTAKEGAAAFTRMLALWPSQELQEGEISWAERYFKRARALLPEQLAQCCGDLAAALPSPTENQAHAVLPALFEFAEWVQRWLWALSASVLRGANLLERAAPWVNGFNGKTPGRLEIQTRLEAMLGVWASATIAKQNPVCLRFLNCIDQAPNTLDIVEALDWLREFRNGWAHGGSIAGANALLTELSLPFRLVMQAASFLAAWPLITEIEPIGSRWRVTCVRGTYPWPKEEWSLKLPPNFRSQPGHVYQAWPHPDGTVGVIDLWPWLECRPDDDFRRQRLWLALGLGDGRNIVEASFNELKEIRFAKNRPAPPFKVMPAARWDELDKIAAKLKI
jgi:hypothetical protein